jgi:hypothetical protein
LSAESETEDASWEVHAFPTKTPGNAGMHDFSRSFNSLYLLYTDEKDSCSGLGASFRRFSQTRS